MNSHGVIRVRLLGTPAIEGTDVDGRAVLRQPKRLLLLAYLAARGEFVTRDTLVGLFWPGSDEDRARRALSQAIHFLRGELGRRAIATRGAGEVAVGSSIECDVIEFDKAVRDETWEAALARYGGDFLDGVVSPRANDLNQWLEAERLRLQRLAVTAATALSDAAYQREDLAASVSWQEKALEINPFDEAAHRTYLALLDEAGDGAGALAAYEVFRARLRCQFDLEPSAETSHIVSLIRSRRPDAVAADAAAPAPPAPGPKAARGPAARAAGAGSRTRWMPAWLRSRPRLQIGLALAALPILIWVAARLGPDRKDPVGPSPFIANRVAVLYFEVNGASDSLRYVAEGLTESLISYLDQASTLEVVPASAVEPFRTAHVAPEVINDRLHAATLISGRLAEEHGQTRLTIQVEDAANGILSKTLLVESDAGNLFGIIDDMTHKVSDALGPLMAEVVLNEQWRDGASNPEALAALMRGATSAKLFDERFRAEDTSLAHGAYNQADSLFREAARLDSKWSTPHVMRGQLAFDRAFAYELRGDFETANTWLARAVDYADDAIDRSPDAAALELKGRVLYEMFALDPVGDLGVLDRADEVLGHAILLDGDRAGAWATRSAVMYVKGNFESAEQSAEDALRLDAFLGNRTEIQNRIFESAFHASRDIKAKETCAEIARSQKGHWTAAQCVLNLMAWSRTEKPDPQRAWRELEANLLSDPPGVAAAQRPQLELMLAAVLARADLPDSAEHVIERAVRAGRGNPEMLYLEAAARMALKQPGQARDLLSRYLKGNPPSRMHVQSYRWFQTPRTPLVEATSASSR